MRWKFSMQSQSGNVRDSSSWSNRGASPAKRSHSNHRWRDLAVGSFELSRIDAYEWSLLEFDDALALPSDRRQRHPRSYLDDDQRVLSDIV